MRATGCSSEHARRARAAVGGRAVRLLRRVGALRSDDDGRAFLQIATDDLRIGAVSHAQAHGHRLRIAVLSDAVDARARSFVLHELSLLAACRPLQTLALGRSAPSLAACGLILLL